MKDLQLADLYNPNKVAAVLHNNGKYYECDERNQAFQETGGRYEIWQKLKDGRLLLVIRWNKSSIIATYKEVK